MVYSHQYTFLTSFYQICDAENESDRVSPDEDPGENKASGTKKNNNKDVENQGQEHEEESTKVKLKQLERSYLPNELFYLKIHFVSVVCVIFSFTVGRQS